MLYLQNIKTDHQKSWPSNVFPEKNFGLILKNKMANYLKIIKMAMVHEIYAKYIWLGKFDSFFNVKWGYHTTKT